MNLKEDTSLGEVYYHILPDFKTIKPYLFAHLPSKDYRKLAKDYQGWIALPFLTSPAGEKFIRNMKVILDRPELEQHQANLAYIITFTYAIAYQRLTDFSVPVNESSKRVQEFISNTNGLLLHSDKRFKISFVEIDDRAERKVDKSKVKKTVKPIRINYNDPTTSEWIVNTLLQAINNGHYPLSLGVQLWGGSITTNALTGEREFTTHAPKNAFESKSKKEIHADAVNLIAEPILNYLQNETTITKAKGEYWSLEQMGFISEVLILTGFYESKVKTKYRFGKDKPSVVDKQTLDSFLHHQRKKGMLLTFSAE